VREITGRLPEITRTYRVEVTAVAARQGPEGASVAAALEAIRAAGGRVTDQRRAMLHVLFEHADHVTADDLADLVHEHLPEVHLTTVYRFLETLGELGVVTHVHLGHGPAVYHLNTTHPTNVGPRAHVVCEGCGAVGVVDAALARRWSAELVGSIGFELVDQHFALAGRCLGCSAPG